MSQTGRMYLCARCREQAVVCRRCDRGQIYCGKGCATQARRQAQRDASRRYQASDRGRVVHAERSRRYRTRQRDQRGIVTHQGSAVALLGDLLRFGANVPMCSIDLINERHVGAHATDQCAGDTLVAKPPSCGHCGVQCSGGVRLGFLRHHRRPLNAEMTDRTIRQALQPRPHDHSP